MTLIKSVSSALGIDCLIITGCFFSSTVYNNDMYVAANVTTCLNIMLYKNNITNYRRKKNTLSKNKFAIAIALIMMISMTVSLIALPAVSAHDPPIDVLTWVYSAAAPNPTGLNQETTLIFWSAIAPPEAGSDPSISWKFDVTVTNPNGNVTSLGRFTSDADGRASTNFTPDMVGTWNVTVNFPATLYGWDATEAQQVWTGDTFLASSYTASFEVQSANVPGPLPVDYYSRGDWFMVTTNYLGYNSPQITGDRYVKRLDDAIGSLTSHVMWSKPMEPGGLAGGNNVGVPGDTFYSGLAYNMRFRSTSTFILDGKLYYREPLGESGLSGGYIIVDIRNGEELLRSAVSSLGMGYSYNGVTCFFSSTSYGDALGPDTLQPLGWSITNVPSGTTLIGPLGEQLRVSIVDVGTDGPEYNIAQWNASKVIVPGLSGEVDASAEEYFDFSVPITYNGQPFDLPNRNILGGVAEDYVVTASSTSSPFTGTRTYWMISLKPEDRGTIIANHTISKDEEPFSQIEENLLQTTSVWDPESHIIPFWSKATLQWIGFNFETGEVWGPTTPRESDWNYYASPISQNLNTDFHTMNGRLLSISWSGILYCYNLTDGTLLFTYGLAGKTANANVTSSGFQTAYGVYPTFAGATTPANGRVYVFVNEHSPNTPLLKGSYYRCIDVINAKEDWIFPSYGGDRPATVSEGTTTIVANGFTFHLNQHDQQIYAMAKGPTATTVTAQSEIVQGDKIWIKGAVIDRSAGTMQDEQASRFPNGVAAVSDEDEDAWMAYVYLHRPRPDVTGVDITLTAVGPDGSTEEIGTATSDSTGYFGFLWEPQAVGSYTVTADFAGSNAYYPSNAQTAFTVSAAPEPPVVEPEPAPLTDTYILGATVGIIIAIAVITGVILLLIRRK